MNSEIDTKKTIALNIQLSEVEKTMLERLKIDTTKSFGQILRDSIILMYRMRFNNEPKCASGEACKCPQMHQIQNVDALTDAELLQSQPDPSATS